MTEDVFGVDVAKSRVDVAGPDGHPVIEAVPPLVATDMTAGRGKGKISADQMARAIRAGVAGNSPVVASGLSRRVLLLNRLFPRLVARMLARK